MAGISTGRVIHAADDLVLPPVSDTHTATKFFFSISRFFHDRQERDLEEQPFEEKSESNDFIDSDSKIENIYLFRL